MMIVISKPSRARRVVGQVHRHVLLPLCRGEGVIGGGADPLDCLADVQPSELNGLIATVGQGAPTNRHSLSACSVANGT
jgi:hypothetical protein